MDFCASLMTVCNVAYLRSSMLLVQTRPMMAKQLQCSLAAAPAVCHHSLTMHCPQLAGWGARFAIYTPIGTCGDKLMVWSK